MKFQLKILFLQPDTYFHTGKGSHLHTITRPNKFLRIFPDGKVLYSMRYSIGLAFSFIFQLTLQFCTKLDQRNRELEST